MEPRQVRVQDDPVYGCRDSIRRKPRRSERIDQRESDVASLQLKNESGSSNCAGSAQTCSCVRTWAGMGERTQSGTSTIGRISWRFSRFWADSGRRNSRVTEQTDIPSIALAVRIRNEWELLGSSSISLSGVISEAWVLDDRSNSPAPAALLSKPVPVHVLRAATWSGTNGELGRAGSGQLPHESIKRRSRAAWVLQLDADERMSDLLSLTDSIGPVRQMHGCCPSSIFTSPLTMRTARTWCGRSGCERSSALRRGGLCAFRPDRPERMSRGAMSARARTAKRARADKPVIEHFGKSVSVSSGSAR